MPVVFHLVEDLLVAQLLEDQRVHFVDGFAREFAETVNIDAVFVEWCDGFEPAFLAELEVFCTGAWSYVDDAGPFVIAYVLPSDDLMLILCARLRGQVVERASVTPTDHLGSGQTLQHLLSAIQDVQAVFGEPQ